MHASPYNTATTAACCQVQHWQYTCRLCPPQPSHTPRCTTTASARVCSRCRFQRFCPPSPCVAPFPWAGTCTHHRRPSRKCATSSSWRTGSSLGSVPTKPCSRKQPACRCVCVRVRVCMVWLRKLPPPHTHTCAHTHTLHICHFTEYIFLGDASDLRRAHVQQRRCGSVTARAMHAPGRCVS